MTMGLNQTAECSTIKIERGNVCCTNANILCHQVLSCGKKQKRKRANDFGIILHRIRLHGHSRGIKNEVGRGCKGVNNLHNHMPMLIM